MCGNDNVNGRKICSPCLESYEARCRPMHFKDRAKKILAEFENVKEAVNLVNEIVQHAKDSKEERDRYLYWCFVKSEINQQTN